MYRTEQQVRERHGRYAPDRLAYLQQLVTEYSTSKNPKAKEQVLANLANFAYDPVNYEHLRRLNVVDLFLDAITEPQPMLNEFGIIGLCNLCPDPQNARFIVENEGIPIIVRCLSSANVEVILAAITTLYYLLAPSTLDKIATDSVVACMEQYACSKNRRLHNAAALFLNLCRSLR